MWRTVFIAVFLMVGMYSAVHAQTSSRELLAAGSKAFKSEQYAEALEHFQKAHSRNGDTRILYNIGRCFEELEQLPEAIEAFQEFLAGSRRSPQEMKNKALERLKNLQTRLKDLQALPTTGTLNVRGNPEGAAVSVDGQSVGVLPLVARELDPGTYVVRVEVEGFEEAEQEVTIKAGLESSLQFALTEIIVEPRTTGPHYHALAWGLVGSGGGMVILGVALSLLGDDYHQTVDQSIENGGVSTLTEGEAKDLQENGDVFKTSGYALMGIGGAVTVGGIVLFLLDDPDAEATTSFGGAPVDGGFVWTYGGRF